LTLYKRIKSKQINETTTLMSSYTSRN